ncbi:MAG: glycosyltransferase [Chloroflexota bacterium]|nr:glycosyltransferase [Chloroflexota bacterium]
MKTFRTTRKKTHAVLPFDQSKALRKASPRLSIILCTYNRRSLVLSTLASLRRQTLSFDLFEVIVVDNGSTDGTLSAVRAYVNAGLHIDKRPEDIWRVHCLSETQNGLAHARHTALLAASGDIAVFLDDDTLADAHFLERLLQAYEETDADAIGGRVELRWEVSRPHWLSDDLLDMLGYFAPFPGRTQLQAPMSFGSSNFSVKIDALRRIDYFSPLLSKGVHMPASLEITDICARLYEAEYTVWYEPDAAVVHRVSEARLIRPFFVGRAYWQGRSSVVVQYLRTMHTKQAEMHLTAPVLYSLARKIRDIAYLALLHRPLLYLASKSSNERLVASMELAYRWGQLRQQFQLLEHAPIEVTSPAVFLVRAEPTEPATESLARSLALQRVSCTTGTASIPLSWLWRHRAYHGQAMGIIHVYSPGALPLAQRDVQRLWFCLWLAPRWGIRIVTSDVGGWWQSTHHLRSLARRTLEGNLFRLSDSILAATRQPDQLYLDKRLRRRLRCLTPPGFRGYYGEAVNRDQAHRRLGLSADTGFVYLCLATMHTERELIYLLESFIEICIREKKQATAERRERELQLLIVGFPQGKKMSIRLLKLAASHSNIHMYMVSPGKEDMPVYIGAADALVQPHFANVKAGILDTSLLALSYGRVVIAPDLPRFRGMLPPRASVLYEPGKRESFMQAFLKAQKLEYTMNEKEEVALNAESGWEHYAHRLRTIYLHILKKI